MLEMLEGLLPVSKLLALNLKQSFEHSLERDQVKRVVIDKKNFSRTHISALRLCELELPAQTDE